MRVLQVGSQRDMTMRRPAREYKRIQTPKAFGDHTIKDHGVLVRLLLSEGFSAKHLPHARAGSPITTLTSHCMTISVLRA